MDECVSHSGDGEGETDGDREAVMCHLPTIINTLQGFSLYTIKWLSYDTTDDISRLSGQSVGLQFWRLSPG